MNLKRFCVVSSTLLIGTALLFNSCSKGSNSTGNNNNNNNTPPGNQYTQYGTPFAGVPDPQDAIIYQVNIRAFSNGANFKGITARLDSIKALGVNVVYLMPVYPVGVLKSAGGLGSPYSVRDYKGVNSEFGNLDDLRALVDGAHARNMAVMFDWVADHTSWDNAWINNTSWYKKDSNGNIISPPGTNWTDVAALDYTNQNMRIAMIQAMKYWVYTANIDGYRCDAADFVPADFWKQAIDSLRAISTHKLLMFAEGTRSDHYTSGFQLRYGMAFYSALKGNVFGSGGTVTQLTDLNNTEYLNATATSQVVRYTTNHDVYSSDGSPVNIYNGKTGSMAAFLVAAYMKGVPMIYNGQEVGCTRDLNIFYDNPIDWSTNPDMTAEYKQILNFRKSSDAVKSGTLAVYSSADVAAFIKSNSAQRVFVIANLRNSNETYTLPADAASSTWSNAFTKVSVTLGTQITLQPYQHMVLVQ